MSQPCAIATCKQTSRVLCHCCNRNLCLDHLINHNNRTNDQSNSLTDQINTLHEQSKRLDTNKLLDDGRHKLDKWRDESVKKIHRFYDKKYEELDRYYAEKVRQQQREIDQLHQKCIDLNQKQEVTNEDGNKELQAIVLDIKQKIDAIEQKGIPINIRSLPIDNHLITIGELKIQEFDLTTLSSPYRTLDCPEKLGSALASNGRDLLIDQSPILTLLDRNFIVIQQVSWEHGTIYDMCWSSSLSSFIIITERSKAFLVDGNNLSINSIEAMHNQLWMSCACSNASLYLTSISHSVVEFSLLPSVYYTRRWDPPVSCKKNEFIRDITCNDDTLALIVAPYSNKMVHLILRSLATFDQMFSVRLDIKHPSYQLTIRCCTFKSNEWLVVDANTSHIFHVGKDGKLKGTLKYDQPPLNVFSFGLNTLVIRTEDNVNFHEVVY